MFNEGDEPDIIHRTLLPKVPIKIWTYYVNIIILNTQVDKSLNYRKI